MNRLVKSIEMCFNCNFAARKIKLHQTETYEIYKTIEDIENERRLCRVMQAMKSNSPHQWNWIGVTFYVVWICINKGDLTVRATLNQVIKERISQFVLQRWNVHSIAMYQLNGILASKTDWRSSSGNSKKHRSQIHDASKVSSGDFIYQTLLERGETAYLCPLRQNLQNKKFRKCWTKY